MIKEKTFYILHYLYETFEMFYLKSCDNRICNSTIFYKQLLMNEYV